jgi:hypothetical protein
VAQHQEEETAQIVSGPNVTALHEQTLDVKARRYSMLRKQ